MVKMKKIIGLLITFIIVMGVVSGLLFFQLNVVQTENVELCDELFDTSNRLNQEKNRNLELEEQVSELQNQTEQLEEEILGLESEASGLENEISGLESEISELESEASGLENEISGLEAQLNEAEKQRDELQKKLDEYGDRINITDLSVFRFGSFGGLLYESSVNVTIQNFGTTDVEGLILTITNNSSDFWTSTHDIDVIHSGETKVITGIIIYKLETKCIILATLKLNDGIIDEYETPLKLQ